MKAFVKEIRLWLWVIPFSCLFVLYELDSYFYFLDASYFRDNHFIAMCVVSISCLICDMAINLSIEYRKHMKKKKAERDDLELKESMRNKDIPNWSLVSEWW